MAPTAVDAAAGRPRALWADVAKGACIILVVLHHLVAKHYVAVVDQPHGWWSREWVDLTYALKPLRMPMFFLVSGIFAAGALRRPWDERQTTRLVGLYFVYACWLVIHAAFFSVATELPMNRTRNVTELLSDLVYASTGLWYLYALAVYVPLARVLLRLGVVPTLALAAVVALLTPLAGIDAANRVAVLQHFVFFVLGALVPGLGARAAGMRRGSTVWLMAGAGVLAWVLSASGVPLGVSKIAISVLAVPAALRVTAGVASWQPAGQVLGHVGRHTLPVYVLHMPVVAVAHHLVADRVRSLASAWPGLLVGFYPVALTVAVVCVCLLLQRALRAIGLGWLFLPTVVSPLVTAVQGRPRRREPVSIRPSRVTGTAEGGYGYR